MKMKSPMILIVTFSVAMSLYGEDLNRFQLELEQMIDLWRNDEINCDLMMASLTQLEDDLELANISWETEYWKSRIRLIKGQIYFEREDKKSSIGELEKSLSFAEESINRKEMSDTWRILSEANSLLMLQKGFLYIIANHTLAQEQAKRALEMDSDNARASLVVAQYLCNAPPIAGGNLEEGLTLLKTLYRRDDLSDIDQFAVLLSLCEINLANEMMSDAMVYCRLALSLYPENRRSNELLSEIEEEVEG